jgi:hypothetical protein
MAGPLRSTLGPDSKNNNPKKYDPFYRDMDFRRRKKQDYTDVLDSTIVLEGWEDVKASDPNITSNSNLTLPLTESLFTAFLN